MHAKLYIIQGTERVGITSRNEIGLLLFEKDDETTLEFGLGSRLKTPVLPIWISRCNGKLGVLFNTNRELMRSYHAENRFGEICRSLHCPRSRIVALRILKLHLCLTSGSSCTTTAITR